MTLTEDAKKLLGNRCNGKKQCLPDVAKALELGREIQVWISSCFEAVEKKEYHPVYFEELGNSISRLIEILELPREYWQEFYKAVRDAERCTLSFEQKWEKAKEILLQIEKNIEKMISARVLGIKPEKPIFTYKPLEW